MKKTVLILLLLGLTLSFALTVDEILDKSEANDNFLTSSSINIEQVYNPDGTVKVSEMKAYSKNGNEKALMEYTEPKRIQGMKILMLNNGDDIWFYSNRTNRVRKIASHQKNQSANGSDFSYDDMSMSDNRKDYNYSLTGEEKYEEKDCYKIEFKAKDEGNTYSRFYVWIDKSNFLAVGAEFYDENRILWKKLSVRDIKKLGKYWTAGEVEMKDVLKDSRTVIKTKEIQFDLELSDDIFTERGLKR
ncbi:MAG: outer membrane lipoprotein-sorting protein, partial [Candidatus Delongbacteria bacterium]|nr:outer membrane lipoprotein-sorting protein [Candidatus Delongbacteria bacterium]MCG2761462.1 outer membrane lipoprotein-sorting protein [Candidatus Delongbacteria bacterium]